MHKIKQTNKDEQHFKYINPKCISIFKKINHVLIIKSILLDSKVTLIYIMSKANLPDSKKIRTIAGLQYSDTSID